MIYRGHKNLAEGHCRIPLYRIAINPEPRRGFVPSLSGAQMQISSTNSGLASTVTLITFVITTKRQKHRSPKTQFQPPEVTRDQSNASPTTYSSVRRRVRQGSLLLRQFGPAPRSMGGPILRSSQGFVLRTAEILPRDTQIKPVTWTKATLRG